MNKFTLNGLNLRSLFFNFFYNSKWWWTFIENPFDTFLGHLNNFRSPIRFENTTKSAHIFFRYQIHEDLGKARGNSKWKSTYRKESVLKLNPSNDNKESDC